MKNYFLLILLLVLLSSCSSKKDIVYLQDVDEKRLENVNFIKPKVVIEINDILKIDVVTLNPESALPFNKTGGQNNMGVMQGGMIKLQGYSVDNNGDIELPLVGRVNVLGLSLREAEEKIKANLSNYLKNPFVSASFVNYKFTIQGEVRSPGTFEVFEPNLTLLQALGMAGDLTIRGKRDDILIIRTIGSKRITRRIDLTKSDWMNSPYYFIKQNDYIYVEPNKPQVSAAGYITGLGSLLGLASFALTITLLLTN